MSDIRKNRTVNDVPFTTGRRHRTVYSGRIEGKEADVPTIDYEAPEMSDMLSEYQRNQETNRKFKHRRNQSDLVTCRRYIDALEDAIDDVLAARDLQHGFPEISQDGLLSIEKETERLRCRKTLADAVTKLEEVRNARAKQ